MTTERNMVDHPDHYQTKSGLEAWDVIKEFTRDLSGEEAWGTQQVLKYMLRWKHKNGKEDLEKALVYLKELIKDVEINEEFDREFAKAMNPPEEVKEDCCNCKHLSDDNAASCLKCTHLVEEGEGIENRFIVNDKTRYYVNTIK